MTQIDFSRSSQHRTEAVGMLYGMYNAAVEMAGIGSKVRPDMQDTYAVLRRRKSAGTPTTHSH